MTLAVIGSYLQSDLQLAFYDFSNPNSLPLPEINRHYFIEFDEVEGWQGEEIFTLKSVKYFRKSDGKPFENLPENECNYLLTSSDLHKEVVQFNKYTKTKKEDVGG